jgi:UDP-N-acetylglucosamine 2-epimerase (non-hydrolysing)
MRKKVFFILGTRPEAIKLAPVIKLFQKEPFFKTYVVSTGQHSEKLKQVFDFFEIEPDFELDVMKKNQKLAGLTAQIISKLHKTFEKVRPDIVLVQGDTTTAFSGALTAFYHQVPVAHIEAGLRTGNLFAPFPEEANRKIISHTGTVLHFAPTHSERTNLKKEGVEKGVHVVGNSVIDALFLALSKIKENEEEYKNFFSFLNPDRKIILVTAHRRESFGKPFVKICESLKNIAYRFPNVDIVYPVHLNPNIKKPAHAILKGISNIYLIDPLKYSHFVWLMNKSHIILTDSGGIQEEAPSLGKPIIVLRDVTERMEGVKGGTAILSGVDPDKIIFHTSELLENPKKYKKMTQAKNPYGDGKTAKKILSLVKKTLNEKK